MIESLIFRFLLACVATPIIIFFLIALPNAKVNLSLEMIGTIYVFCLIFFLLIL